MENNSIPSSLTEAILSREAINSAAEIADAAFAMVLPSTLSRIPGVGALLSVLEGAVEVRHRFLLKKLGNFLDELRSVPDAERFALRNELQRRPEFRERVGEHLMLILDRLDDTEKARLVGKLFSAYLGKKISYDTFQLACTGVDRAHLSDLLSAARDGEALHGDIGARMFAAGLATLKVVSLERMPQLGGLGNGFQIYPLNAVGETVLEVCYPHYRSERESSRRRKAPLA